MKRELRDIFAAGMGKRYVKLGLGCQKPDLKELLLNGYRRVQKGLAEDPKKH